MSRGRYVTMAAGTMCEDCGALVGRTEYHDRFHAILDDHARAIAVLVNSHVGRKPHDKYDVAGRIAPKVNFVSSKPTGGAGPPPVRVESDARMMGPL